MEGKGSFFVLLLIVAFLTLTLAVLAGYLFFFSGAPKTTAVTSSAQETTKIPADDELEKKKLFAEKRNFNLKKTNSNEIAVIMVSAELIYFKKVKEIKTDIPTKLEFYDAEIKQSIATYFQNMTLEEAQKPETKEKASQDLKKTINEILTVNEKEKVPIVYNIIFDEWFYQ